MRRSMAAVCLFLGMTAYMSAQHDGKQEEKQGKSDKSQVRPQTGNNKERTPPQAAQKKAPPPAQFQQQKQIAKGQAPPQRSQQQAQAWQQKRGWVQPGGWQGHDTWQANRAARWSGGTPYLGAAWRLWGLLRPSGTFQSDLRRPTHVPFTSAPSYLSGIPALQLWRLFFPDAGSVA